MKSGLTAIKTTKPSIEIKEDANRAALLGFRSLQVFGGKLQKSHSGCRVGRVQFKTAAASIYNKRRHAPSCSNPTIGP